jgi:hypothetical protein
MKKFSPPSMKVVFLPLPIPHSLLPTFKLEGSPNETSFTAKHESVLLPLPPTFKLEGIYFIVLNISVLTLILNLNYSR